MQSLRRQPQQQRSRERVDLIIDTAAQLLAEVGASGTTITAVAERAGLAQGSIYEWVLSDRELIGAVAERGLDAMHYDLVEVLRAPSSLEEAIRGLIAGLQQFLDRFRNEVGFRQALAFMGTDPELSQINIADTKRNASAITAVLESLHADPDPDLGSRVLLITHLSGSLAELTAQMSPEEAQPLVAEFENMVERVLGS